MHLHTSLTPTIIHPQELIAQLHQGQGIILYKEPSNPAAPHAVAVRTAGMQHLGYLPKHAAQQWQLQVRPHGGISPAVVVCQVERQQLQTPPSASILAPASCPTLCLLLVCTLLRIHSYVMLALPCSPAGMFWQRGECGPG